MGRSFYRKVLAPGAQKNAADLLAGIQAKPGEYGIKVDQKKDAAAIAAAKAEKVKDFTSDRGLSAATQCRQTDPAVGSTDETGEDATSIVCKTEAVASLSPAAIIFPDWVVCEVLGIERYKVVGCRRDATRGNDWDIVGMQAGMTRSWLIRELMIRGQKEREAVDTVDQLEAVKANGNAVTCKVVGVWPNLERVTVEVIATGKREVAEVPRIDLPPTQHDTTPMGLGWQFDAVRCGGELKWMSYLNNFSYYRSRT